MSIPYSEREKAVKELFDYEEKNRIPENERLTMDPYKGIDAILEASPRKKAYVDIRTIIQRVKDLKYNNKI